MITIILSGGLGNQMFQYAAGKSLSLKFNAELHIDPFLLTKKTKTTVRNFDLDVFNIKIEEKNSFKNKIITKGYSYFKKYRIKNNLYDLLNVFEDKRAQYFDERFENLSDNSTLFGYFQNEKYFQKASTTIREDFEFIGTPDHKNAEIIDKIKQIESISIHIRRGDYTNPKTNLSLIGLEYYQKAIEHIKNKINCPEFYIFSDDIKWVKEYLDLKETNHVFVDINHGINSYRDLQLMSLCKHNIIANSSFSWWGAWLNKNPDKIVITPDTWYKGDNKKDFPEGFIPKEWTILDI